MKHIQLQTRAAVLAFRSRPLALAAVLALAAIPALAEIAQDPLGSTAGVPPNLMFALSVEFPTGDEYAYKGGSDYNNANRYIGYFDPEGCYTYSAGNFPPSLISPLRSADKAKNEYFYKTGVAINRQCNTNTTNKGFSGNFMNWATMQALDEFRLAMTGGDRVVDTTGMTILQKARNEAWGRFYLKSIPLNSDSIRIMMQRSVPPEFESPGLTVTEVSVRSTNANGTEHSPFLKASDQTFPPPPAFTSAQSDDIHTRGRVVRFVLSYRNNSTGDGSLYQNVYMLQVKVCDPNAPGGLEYNGEGDLKLCKAYPNNGGTPIYKPVGLIQKYADQIRFGATSYLLDNSTNRAGGVLRARLKSVGETLVGPEGGANNPNKEWDPQTGIYIKNPDATDATASGVANSGVINYLNKFGKANGYKEYDTLSELYYAAQLAVRNVAPPARFTSGMTQTMKDDFPVITTKPAPDENDIHQRPIQYACQKSHFVGIADANTNFDIYAPGSTRTTSYGANHTWDNGFDSTVPGLNVMTLTNKIGQLETATSPITTLSGRTPLANYQGFAKSATYFVAGLAYWANTQDMLPDGPSKPWTHGKQQGKTWFVDVVEEMGYGNRDGSYAAISCSARANTPNQMYMAAKYGGFDHQNKPESEYQTLLSETNKSTSWDKNGDCVPDNYFLASQPEQLVSSLSKIIETIVAEEPGGTRSTGAMVATSIALESETQLYQSSFDPADWSGTLKGFGFCTIGKIGTAPGCTAAKVGLPLMDANGNPLTDTASGGWVSHFPTHDKRKIYTRTVTAQTPSATEPWKNWLWAGRTEFKDSQSNTLPLSTLAATDALRKKMINFLRGNTAYDGKTEDGQTFRQRNGKLLGDIVNSGAAYVEPGAQDYGWGRAPNFTAAQKTAYQTRRATALLNANSKKTVFIGANDGMLHAFEANPESAARGVERFAYIPASAYEHLARLTRTDYSHRYFVDGTPVAGDYWNGSAWRTLLVTSTGAGGRSYFALDVENPDDPKVQWEVSGGGDDASAPGWLTQGDAHAFANLGVAIGRASIVPTNDPAHPWVAIFGNGYDSRGTALNPPVETNQPNRARLFIVDAKTGALVKQISTGVGNASVKNGLSTPLAVDYDGNGSADAVYAGDLQGNLWKFDLRSTVSSWGLAFDGQPLLKATDADTNGQPQPITAQPEAMRRKGKPNELMIYVGSGKWMETGDPANRQVQTFYGVADPCGHGGTCTVASIPYTRANLQAQTLTASTVPNEARYGAHAGEAIRSISKNAPSTGHDKGFYVDLMVGNSKTGERVIANAKIYYDRVRFYSLSPVSNSGGDLCEGSTTEGWIYEFDPWTGARLDYAFGGAYSNLAAGVRVPDGSGQRGVTIGSRDFTSPGVNTPDKGKIRYGRRTWRQFH